MLSASRGAEQSAPAGTGKRAQGGRGVGPCGYAPLRKASRAAAMCVPPCTSLQRREAQWDPSEWSLKALTGTQRQLLITSVGPTGGRVPVAAKCSVSVAGPSVRGEW